MSQIRVANFPIGIGQFFKSASMFTPTSSIVTISAISSGSITFTPALSNYTTIRSASLSWLDSTSLGPFYSVTGGGYFPVIDSTAFSVLFSFGSTTTIVTQSNSSFIFNSSSIVGASTRQFSISYLTQSIQSYYDDTVEEAYVQLTIDTTNNENSIKFDTGLLNSTTGEVEFTSNTPVKGGIGTSARGMGSFAMGSGSIAQESASVAEGINTLASGLASHAAGINTTASGQAAFSMGIETDADGMASFAAGSGSWARGTATVAFGIGTIASSSGQLVVGHYNETKTDKNNIFVVGDGTGPLSANRRNIIEVYGGQGAGLRGVKIDTAATPTISPTIDGFNVYGQTYLRGNTDIFANKITSIGDTTLGLSGSIIFEAYNLLPALVGRTVMDWKGINFDDAFGGTSPGSTYLWRNNDVNHLYYSSSQLIQNGGNNTAAVAIPLIIGTANASNLELETNNTTRIFISSSGNVGIGTSSPTERLHVQGNSLFSGSLKFEPTQDPDLAGLDTDSTILFQSSSNTLLGYDLYFRQNGNLVKWKWFEGLLESGLLYGGVVTYSGSFVYVSSGSGILVDHNAVTGSEIGPIVDYITWGPITQSITNIATQQLTYIYIDDTGALQQQSTAFTSQQYHSSIPLGAVAHFNYNSIGSFGGSVQTSYDQTSQILTFVDAFGPLKISGYGITGQSSSLQISVGSGTSFIHGGFYDNDPQFPSEILTTSQLTASIVYVHRSGSGVKFDSNNNNYFTSLRPGFYDPGTGNTASLSSNNWTIQRAYSEPKTGIVYVYYGQNVYTTYNEAVANVSSDSFTEGDTFNYTTFLGFLILKSDTTDITNTSDNKIITAGLFRGGAGGAGGGSVVSSLDDLSDVSILSPTNGQALVYNSSTSLWGNGVPVTSSYALTASFITPTGTNAFVQGGNSFGTTALLGTNDTQDLQLETSGSARMTINSSGNIGIGTTSPSVRLHLSQSSGTFQRVDINNANADAVNATTEYYTNTGATPDLFGATSFRLQGGTTDAFKQFQVYIANLTSPKFIINGSGNVGIGTTSPNARLHISGANNGALLIVSSSAAPSALFVSGSGNVGIGIGTPVHNLVVNGNTGVSINADGATFPNIHRDSADGGMLLRSWNGSTFTNNVKITPTTEVGIGTTTPTAELHISGASNSNLLRVGSPTNANILFVTGSGNIGIGTATPTNTLQVVGGITATSITASIISASSGITASQYSGVPTFTYNDNNFQSVNIINTSNTSNALNGLTIYSASNASVGQFLYLNPIYANSALRDTVLFNSVGDRKLGFVANTTTAAGANSDIYFQAGSTTAGRMIYISGQAGAMGIGMGASTPTSTNRLQVRGQGATSATTALRVENSSAAARLTILDDGTSAFNTSHLYVSSSGRVGVGTTTPRELLHVGGGNLSLDSTRYIDFGNGNSRINDLGLISGQGYSLRITTFGPIGTGTANSLTEKLRLTGSGSLGLGTDSPSARFHISGGFTDGNLMRVQSPTGAEYFFISASGNVGIGTNLPSAELHISGASADNLLRIGSPTNSDILFVTGSGRVSINKTTPNSVLDVNGNTIITGSITNTSTITTLGSIVTPSQTIAVGNGFGNSSGTTNLLNIAGNLVPTATAIINSLAITSTVSQSVNPTTIIRGILVSPTFNTLGPQYRGFEWNNNQGFGLYGVGAAPNYLSGSLGIGTISPSASLHISGASNAGLFEIDSPTINNIIYVSGSGNVGIGTNLPSADLHISGASADSLLRVGSPTDSNILFITGSGRVGVGTSVPNAKLHISSNSGYQLRVAASASFSSSLMVSGSFGYVGIGVESPQSLLHVNDRPEFNNVTGNVPVAFIGNYQNITTFYNNNSQDNTVLGDPAAWMSIKCDGTEYLIPLYTS